MTDHLDRISRIKADLTQLRDRPESRRGPFVITDEDLGMTTAKHEGCASMQAVKAVMEKDKADDREDLLDALEIELMATSIAFDVLNEEDLKEQIDDDIRFEWIKTIDNALAQVKALRAENKRLRDEVRSLNKELYGLKERRP